MKKSLMIILVLLLVGLVGCSEGGSGNGKTDGEKIVLTVSTHTNENHYSHRLGIKPWMDKVEELTDGQVEFEYFPNEQLGDAKDMYLLINNKTTDISFGYLLSDKMPLSDLPMLAGMFDTAYEGTRAYWEVTSQGTLLDIWTSEHNMRPIFSWVVPPYTVSTIKKKVESLDDMQDLTMRSTGGIFDLYIQQLGATPTAISVVETLESLERGVIDGQVNGWSSMIPYQHQEVINYAISNAPLNGWGGFFAINEEVYQSLPQNVKDAMAEASNEIVLNMAEVLNDENEKNLEVAIEAGVEVYPLDSSEVEKWREILLPVTEKWIQEREDKGLPAQEVYDQFKAAVEKYKKN
jgi:TRAP-type C4-dicarboxylate transport system substrate-binding protein